MLVLTTEKHLEAVNARVDVAQPITDTGIIDGPGPWYTRTTTWHCGPDPYSPVRRPYTLRIKVTRDRPAFTEARADVWTPNGWVEVVTLPAGHPALDLPPRTASYDDRFLATDEVESVLLHSALAVLGVWQ